MLFLCLLDFCCRICFRIWQPQSETLLLSQCHLFTGKQVCFTGPVMDVKEIVLWSSINISLFLVCSQTVSCFEVSDRRRAMRQWGGLWIHDSLFSSRRGTTHWGASTSAKTPTVSASVSTPGTGPTLCSQLTVFKLPLNPQPAYQEKAACLS